MSGRLRRYAFQYSESDYRHWLPLMLADRVGAVEGILEDLGRGHVPNLPAELGWCAEWKHNRRGLVTRVVVGTLLVAACVGYLRDRES